MMFKEKLLNLGFKEEECCLDNEIFLEKLFQLYEEDLFDLENLYLHFKIKSKDFLQLYAKKKDFLFMDFDDFQENLAFIPPLNMLLAYHILPLKTEKSIVYIAGYKPFSLELLEKLQYYFKDKFVKAVFVDSIELLKYLERIRIRGELNYFISNLKKEWKQNLQQQSRSFIQQILDFILHEALKINASDIHLEAEKDEALIRFRIDGVLNFFCSLEREVYESLIFHIKFLAQLNVAESRKAQDGNFEFIFEDKNYDLRLSFLPLLYGESLVMRILKHDSQIIELDNLNIDVKDLHILRKGISFSNGMILFTGPTGSGKSTSLYACLNELKSMEKKIISVEDPIEYKIPMVQQILLNSKAGFDFHNVLRAILRQDPDIIMIGEIRDEESLDIALKSSLTGHLLLSTLHTNDTFSTLDRLMDMKAKSYLIASALKMIVSQRLIRKLCPRCKEEVYYQDFNKIFYVNKGCMYCSNTGFIGRELLAEIMLIDHNISLMIRDNAKKEDMLAYAKKQGFKTMFETGMQKVEEGITSLEELLRVL